MTIATTSETKRFSDFALAPDVIEALTRLGIERPTPIQEGCIPPIIEGKDVVGKAETGTGKTIGFGAPIVSRIDTNRVAIQALILTPTRELAQQVAGVLSEMGAGRNLGVALVVGGVHASEQVLKLRSGSQVVVGTPGRVLDFLGDRTMSLVWCETVVLDEADRMLDMGFIDDVSKILDNTPQERQTLLFSATVPPEIKNLLHRYMKDPVMVSTSSGLTTVPEIKQTYVEAEFRDKFRTLQRLLDSLGERTAIIFCNTRRQAIDLDRMLWGHGYSAGALHGEQEQEARFKTLDSFRRGDVKVLVATDVASRGLDIEDVGCVINYEIPDEPEAYVHRIGRTGRAQKSGMAVSIVSGKEWGNWQRILRQTGFPIERSGPERVRKGGRDARDGRDRRDRGGARDRHGRSNDSARGRGRGDRRDRPRGDRPRDGRGAGPGPGPRSERADEFGSGLVTAPVASSGEPPGSPAGGAGEGHPPPAGEGAGKDRGERRRRRRRGRRDGRGGQDRERGAQDPSRGGGPRDDAPADFEGGPSGESAPGFPPRSSPGQDEPEPAGEGETPLRWPAKPAAEKQKERPRLKLDDLDDDFVKVDYFDVDHSLIKDAPPAAARHPDTPRSRPDTPRSRPDTPRPHPREGRGDRHGRPPRASPGRGHAPANHGAARGPERQSHEAGARSQPEGGGGGPDGGRRRRRRRRRRGSSGGGGGGAAGPQGPPAT
jgi:ATP-dependent RNA helicase DeaD